MAAQWVVLAYLLTVAALLKTMGRLVDLGCKKIIFLCRQVIFALGPLLCGMAPPFGFMVGFRVLQGLGAYMVVSQGITALTGTSPAWKRGWGLEIVRRTQAGVSRLQDTLRSGSWVGQRLCQPPTGPALPYD